MINRQGCRSAYVLLVVALAACAQTPRAPASGDGPALWLPPSLHVPRTLPQPELSNDMITALRVAKVKVILDEAGLRDMRKRLGGEIGIHSYVSATVAWLCFSGTDETGRWALWLESEGVGSPVDGFTWIRLDPNARVDQRCRTFPEGAGGIKLPGALRLGAPETQVRKVLGAPNARHRNNIVFDHKHKETIRKRRVMASNIVTVGMRGGVVWAIQVWENPVSGSAPAQKDRFGSQQGTPLRVSRTVQPMAIRS